VNRTTTHRDSARLTLATVQVAAYSQMKEAIIVDEVSMLDLFIVKRLVEFSALRTNVILVGDPHQLYPIDPGQVFRDLFESGQVPILRILQWRNGKRREEAGTLETIKALLLN
jgi:ATP-dependent exoDNAse (exonuclease V) alpha subunit